MCASAEICVRGTAQFLSTKHKLKSTLAYLQMVTVVFNSKQIQIYPCLAVFSITTFNFSFKIFYICNASIVTILNFDHNLVLNSEQNFLELHLFWYELNGCSSTCTGDLFLAIGLNHFHIRTSFPFFEKRYFLFWLDNNWKNQHIKKDIQ